MTTVSVPLPSDLLDALEKLIARGSASNKADVIRRALRCYLEQQAVEDVLRASEEPRLRGKLRNLARKL
ncbi:MAG: ribbon-helix-helix domain-containing protein [Candidatus Peregrinibacteria bacterium]